jgi:hypothetical protein
VRTREYAPRAGDPRFMITDRVQKCTRISDETGDEEEGELT